MCDAVPGAARKDEQGRGHAVPQRVVARLAVPSTRADGLPWITVSQMRHVDQLMTDDMGISLLQMMENAGRNLAVLARDLLRGDASGRRVHVLAGSGGNGGGGLAAARHLHSGGADVTVSLSSPFEDLAPATAHQLSILQRIGLPVRVDVPHASEPELVLDALLGYSQRGSPRGEHARLIEWSSGHRLVALDVPSGLELETGTVHSPCARAAATLTLALPKRGLRTPGAAAVVGRLFVADISVPPVVYDRVGAPHRSPFGAGPVVRLAVETS